MRMSLITNRKVHWCVVCSMLFFQIASAIAFEPQKMASTLNVLKRESRLHVRDAELFASVEKTGQPTRGGVLGHLEEFHSVRFRVEIGDRSRSIVTVDLKQQSFGAILTTVLDGVNCEFAVLPNGEILVKPKPEIVKP